MWFEAVKRCARQPVLFGLAVTLTYFLLALPMLARSGFDMSVFIVAGDRFVQPAQTPSPIIVRRHSDGYDGQFYYRLALAPMLPQADAFGVKLDHPAWRMQRILLPLLARVVADDRDWAIPAALFGVNLASLFALGWLAMGIARARNFPPAVPLAIVAWPGLLIALTHDTTEILAAALLLGGVAAWLGQRFLLSGLLLALAALTRETTILFIGGLLAAAIWRHRWREACCAAGALSPFLAWRQFVETLWREAPQAHGVAHNIGWPLLGFAQLALANVANRAVGMAHAPRGPVARVTVLWSVAILLWFCLRTARAAWSRDSEAGLAAGWLLVLTLMSLMTANGPWVEPTAYFRAWTECWVLGCVLLGTSIVSCPRPFWLVTATAPLLLRNWELCWIQLK